MLRTELEMNANIIRNSISGVLAGYGFASFFCFVVLQSRWFELAPRYPNLALGLYLQHNEHGGIVYFSAFQSTSCALLFATSVSLGFLSVFIIPKKNLRIGTRFITSRAFLHLSESVGIPKSALL